MRQHPHRRRAGAIRVLALVFLVLAAARAPARATPATAPGSACRFCQAEQPLDAVFCSMCGRLFKLRGPEPESRFWGDAFYVFDYPKFSERPEIQATVGVGGIEGESVSFPGGDRYRVTSGNGGIAVVGKIRAWGTSKEVAYRAVIRDSFAEDGRLRMREVHAEIQAKPKRHLYRKLELHYDGPSLEGIDVGTWLYKNGNDWEKSPGQWIRHRLAELRFGYSADGLSEVIVVHREGKRDLRGKLEYEPAVRYRQEVFTESGRVTGYGKLAEEATE